MLITKFIISKVSFFTSLMIVLNLIIGSFSSSVLAETNQTDSQNATSDSNIGMPTHRRDGGSRSGNDNCVASDRNLVALIPENTVALTASASPELFFYVPKTSQEKTIEFVLRNEADEFMYEAFLKTNGQGIMSVEIPSEVESKLLKEEGNYHWYLSIICNSQQRSRDIVVEGWIRQSEIGLTLKQKLNTSDAIAQANLYHDRGLWYDALSVLAEQKKAQTNEPSIQAKWTEILESEGLGDLASESFVDSKVIGDSSNLEANRN